MWHFNETKYNWMKRKKSHIEEIEIWFTRKNIQNNAIMNLKLIKTNFTVNWFCVLIYSMYNS